MHFSELARTTHRAGRLCAFADERVKSCDCDTCIRHRRYLIESQTLLIILSNQYNLFKRYLFLKIPKMNVIAQKTRPSPNPEYSLVQGTSFPQTSSLSKSLLVIDRCLLLLLM
jgi:hypothetical protein